MPLFFNVIVLFLYTVLESLHFRGPNRLCFFRCESVLDDKFHAKDCQWTHYDAPLLFSDDYISSCFFTENENDKSYCNYLSSDAFPSLQLPTKYITERVGIIATKFERTRQDFRKSPSSYLIWLVARSDTSRLTKLALLALCYENETRELVFWQVFNRTRHE